VPGIADLSPVPGHHGLENGAAESYLLLHAWGHLSATELEQIAQSTQWVDNGTALGVAAVHITADAAWNRAFLPEIQESKHLDGRHMFIAAAAAGGIATAIDNPASPCYDTIAAMGETGLLWSQMDSGWSLLFLGETPWQKPRAVRIIAAFLISPEWLVFWDDPRPFAQRPAAGA